MDFNIQNKKSSFVNSSILYIVPTPIGNLNDITYRAIGILKKVDYIIVENIHRASLLLKHFSINNVPLITLNAYNEHKKTNALLSILKKGQSIALISNAGTPVINDPGFYLIKCCKELNIRIIPLPGACAAITALTASGMNCNSFCYEGFLPKTHKKRINYLNMLEKEKRTLIFYESTHRILPSLKDMMMVLGKDRNIVFARELTKIWETIYSTSIEELVFLIEENKICYKGEITLIVEGYNKSIPISSEALETFNLLKIKLSKKNTISLVSKIYNINRNLLYRYILKNNL
ncbi:16S rRNA (cytidine(1402)-2'-O)-methyltransferase [Candidatus Schneideria nysicola]|nr:16S rRNA (cytidine(1402)-2'-O)-methyltransferase [Candidatus Schneideria nysicola]UAJ64915.1 16S rRNA (cytidine(1402)-2'-O)-methyltransferase [Candidatus Schneideria nysicola]